MTLPKTTWSTRAGSRPDRSSAPRAATTPSSTAPRSLSAPPNAPNGVRAPTRMTTSSSGGGIPLIVADQRVQRVALDLPAPVEERQLDHERDADDLAAELLDQPERRRHRPAGREQIVDGEDLLAGPDSVHVDRERVPAVLELVLDFDRLPGELAELPHRHEARAELVGERAAEDEAAGLDADDDLDARVLVPRGQMVDDVVEGRRVLEERRDVLEEDALGREVLDVADLRTELGDFHDGPYVRRPSARQASVPTRGGRARGAAGQRGPAWRQGPAAHS